MKEASWSVESLSLAQRNEIDRICVSFEDAYLRRESPLLEDFLRQASPDLSAALLCELIRLDLHYAASADVRSAAHGYRGRFPEYEQAIDAALRVASSQDRRSQSTVPGPEPDGNRFVCLRCLTLKPVGAAGGVDNDRCQGCGAEWTTLASPRNASSDAPTRIGRFTLTRCVGEGQFGMVWLARDDALGREVALKIPRQEQFAHGELESFLREARAAAQLHHPNIVAVHDAGCEGATFYLVSDYIEGCTLAAWLGVSRPTPREAAHLAQTLALALHYAHESGVVHRDLKPSNILLRGGSSEAPSAVAGLTPLITDFGLAKREAGEATLALDGRIVGTPAYMPPEQARGEGHHADRRSDVYSLGVILYELLTGELPFQGNVRMLLHQILQESPPRPRDIADGVPRDLETIALKCLEKEPSRRYASAQELADDLGRYLRREPILARPVTTLERSWRWCERNPGLALMAASLCAVLLLGLSGVTWQWRRAVANAEQAEASTKEAGDNARLAGDVVQEFLTTVSEDELLDVPGMQPLRRQLLEKSLAYFEELAQRPASGAWAQEESARALQRVGYIQHQLGQADQAAKTLAQAAARWRSREATALDVMRATAGRAEALDSLAICQAQLGRTQDALSTFRESIALRQELFERHGEAMTPARRQDLLTHLLESYVQFTKLTMAGEFKAEEAQEFLDQALQIAGEINSPATAPVECTIAVAELHGLLGEVYRREGDDASALAAREEAVQVCEAAIPTYPKSLDLRQELAMAHGYLGQMHMALGDPQSGRNSLLKARDMNQALVDENPNLFQAYEQLAFCINLLAIGEMDYGDLQASIPYHQQSIAVRRKMLEMNPAAQACRSNLAQSLLALSAAYSIRLDVDQSLAAIEECVPMLESATRDEPQLIWLRRDLTQAYSFRAQAYLNKERFDEALRDIEQVEQLVAELAPHAPDDPFYAQKLREADYLRISALCELSRWQEALNAADAIDTTNGGDPRILVEIAETLANHVLRASSDMPGKESLPEEWKGRFTSAAVRLLEQAVQNGYDVATLPADGAIAKLRKPD